MDSNSGNLQIKKTSIKYVRLYISDHFQSSKKPVLHCKMFFVSIITDCNTLFLSRYEWKEDTQKLVYSVIFFNFHGSESSSPESNKWVIIRMKTESNHDKLTRHWGRILRVVAGERDTEEQLPKRIQSCWPDSQSWCQSLALPGQGAKWCTSS